MNLGRLTIAAFLAQQEQFDRDFAAAGKIDYGRSPAMDVIEDVRRMNEWAKVARHERRRRPWYVRMWDGIFG